ncbi:hypothetical protein LMH73_016895 [Vibrio splendidus]|nr:hypothetical protein [Vibrio splendidus]MCC4881835.1 hypothetical protein [Vibrio splendidus]
MNKSAPIFSKETLELISGFDISKTNPLYNVDIEVFVEFLSEQEDSFHRVNHQSITCLKSAIILSAEFAVEMWQEYELPMNDGQDPRDLKSVKIYFKSHEFTVDFTIDE